MTTAKTWVIMLDHAYEGDIEHHFVGTREEAEERAAHIAATHRGFVTRWDVYEYPGTVIS